MEDIWDFKGTVWWLSHSGLIVFCLSCKEREMLQAKMEKTNKQQQQNCFPKGTQETLSNTLFVCLLTRYILCRTQLFPGPGSIAGHATLHGPSICSFGSSRSIAKAISSHSQLFSQKEDIIEEKDYLRVHKRYSQEIPKKYTWQGVFRRLRLSPVPTIQVFGIKLTSFVPTGFCLVMIQVQQHALLKLC